jgi:hypothetical protein
MGCDAFNPELHGLMVFVHEQVDLAALDGVAHILGSEDTQPFQVDFRTERNHPRIDGYGVVWPGVSAAVSDPIALAAAERTGAVSGDFHRECGAGAAISCIFQPGARCLLFCFR